MLLIICYFAFAFSKASLGPEEKYQIGWLFIVVICLMVSINLLFVLHALYIQIKQICVRESNRAKAVKQAEMA